jgi:hypothetical protein
MSKFRKSVVISVLMSLVILLGSSFIATSSAADSRASVELLTAYVYHGKTYSEDAVVQPSLDISSGNIGFNVFASFDLDDNNGNVEKDEFSEVDLSVYIFGELKGLDCELKYSEYLYPHATTEDGGPVPGDKEIILSAEKKITAGLSAKLFAHFDTDEIKDYYAALKLVYAVAPTKKFGIGCSGLIGYVGKDESIAGEAGLHEYTLSVGAAYSVTDDVTMSATVYHSASLDEDVLPDQEVETFGSIGCSWAL